MKYNRAWKNRLLATLLVSGLCAAFGTALAQTPKPKVEKPMWVPGLDGSWRIARLPDKSLMAIIHGTAEGKTGLVQRTSRDNGKTWSAVKFLFPMTAELGSPEPLVDRNGEFQFFFLKGRDKKTDDDGSGMPMGIDIWHCRSRNGRKELTTPVQIWRGYCGSMNCEMQMRNGRILFPFSYYTPSFWGNRPKEGLRSFTYYGRGVCTLLYSDDDGATWQLSPSNLRVSTPDLMTDEGAIEPVLTELSDGRVWMLLRTQHGRFYESFSKDGITWSEPRPTRILSSDSPAGLVRLNDGRIVMLWNNCLRFSYAYGGRHVLHAAISSDDGKTWRGFREVARNPKRDEPPPPRGDHGATYPIPMAANDGIVISTTGLPGPHYNIILDPAWLLETSQKDDFSEGLEDWSVFGVQGVALVNHPEKSGKKALSLRKTSEEWPATAVRNFPSGVSGTLRLRLQIQPGFGGALIGLTDHYSVPFDDLDRYNNLFNLAIAPDGSLGGEGKLTPGRWHTLEFRWNGRKRECQVKLDGKAVTTLRQERDTLGVCYVRLRSTATATDTAGLLLESVEAQVSP